jgi:serine/threonine protein kinase
LRVKDNIEVMNKIIREPAPVARHVQSECTRRFTTIVRRCLAKDPEQRYQNIKDVAIELKEVRREMQERGGDTTVPPVSSTSSDAPTIWQSETTRVQTHASTAETPLSASTRASSAEFIVNEIKVTRLHGFAGAVLVVILAIGAAVGIRSYLHAVNTEVAIESIAVVPFVNQSKDPNAEWISDGLTETLINNLTACRT